MLYGMLYGMRGCGGSASARMLSASFPPAFLRADQPQLCEEEVVDFGPLLGLAACLDSNSIVEYLLTNPCAAAFGVPPLFWQISPPLRLRLRLCLRLVGCSHVYA